MTAADRIMWRFWQFYFKWILSIIIQQFEGIEKVLKRVSKDKVEITQHLQHNACVSFLCCLCVLYDSGFGYITWPLKWHQEFAVDILKVCSNFKKMDKWEKSRFI